MDLRMDLKVRMKKQVFLMCEQVMYVILCVYMCVYVCVCVCVFKKKVLIYESERERGGERCRHQAFAEKGEREKFGKFRFLTLYPIRRTEEKETFVTNIRSTI